MIIKWESLKRRVIKVITAHDSFLRGHPTVTEGVFAMMIDDAHSGTIRKHYGVVDEVKGTLAAIIKNWDIRKAGELLTLMHENGWDPYRGYSPGMPTSIYIDDNGDWVLEFLPPAYQGKHEHKLSK